MSKSLALAVLLFTSSVSLAGAQQMYNECRTHMKTPSASRTWDCVFYENRMYINLRSPEALKESLPMAFIEDWVIAAIRAGAFKPRLSVHRAWLPDNKQPVVVYYYAEAWKVVTMSGQDKRDTEKVKALWTKWLAEGKEK